MPDPNNMNNPKEIEGVKEFLDQLNDDKKISDMIEEKKVFNEKLDKEEEMKRRIEELRKRDPFIYD